MIDPDIRVIDAGPDFVTVDVAKPVVLRVRLQPTGPEIIAVSPGSNAPRRRGRPPTDPETHRQHMATVRAWNETRAANWPADRKPPTVEDDIEQARMDLKQVPISYIRAGRYPLWRQGRGRPIKTHQK